RIVALGRTRALRRLVEIARVLAVVKNHLLVKVIDVIKHGRILPRFQSIDRNALIISSHPATTTIFHPPWTYPPAWMRRFPACLSPALWGRALVARAQSVCCRPPWDPTALRFW